MKGHVHTAETCTDVRLSAKARTFLAGVPKRGSASSSLLKAWTLSSGAEG